MLGLVRQRGRPLGFVDVSAPDGRVEPDQLGGVVAQQLGTPLTRGSRDGSHCPTEVPEGAPRKSVSVVVATRDRPESLERCLTALLEVEYPNYEIVVVDNAPTSQATAELVQRRSRTDPRVRYVREDRPGLGWAHNAGLGQAAGEIIALTDDDVVVDRRWLAALARGFETTRDVGCVTGLVVPLELETPAQLWFEQYGGFNKGFKTRTYDLAKHRPDDRLYPYRAGMFGAGANMAFRRDALEAIGGFDRALGPGTLALGGEDLDVFYRTLTAGHRLVYTPAALVYHEHRSSYAELRWQIYTWGAGLAAFLTKALAARPSAMPGLALKIPYGLAFTLATRSRQAKPAVPRHVLQETSYPAELLLSELRGMLSGPWGYLRSRRSTAPLAGVRPFQPTAATPSPGATMSGRAQP
jgi:GT2 family glycosyltransferase